VATSPSVMVRVLGDLSGLGKAFKQSGSDAKAAASNAHAAFTQMLGQLNQSGVLGPFGEAVSKVDEGLSALAEHGKTVGNVMLGAGGTLVAVGSVFAALGSKEQAAHNQLAQAITNTGHSYDQYGKQIDEAIKHNEKFGQSSEATQGALQTLTQATGDPAKALHLLSTATDLAAAKHIDLVTAASQVGKVYNGNTKLLKEFGIQVVNTKSLTSQMTSAQKQSTAADDNLARAKRSLADIELVDSQRHKLTLGQQIQLRNAQEAVATATVKAKEAHQHLSEAQRAVTDATKGHADAATQLGDKLKGQAAASADTFTGHLKAIGVTMEDQAAKWGQKYGPAVQKAGVLLTAFGGIMNVVTGYMKAQKAAQEAAAAATEVEAGAETAADVAGLPLIVTLGLIGLAVAALVAIGYVIYKNWNTIWAGIKAAIEAVFNWIKKYWPLLVAIIGGPIAAAAILLWKNWARIESDAKAVIDFIVSIWNGLVGWISGIPTQIHVALAGMWNFVSNEANTVYGWVVGVWNTMLNWLVGLPSAVVRRLSGLWNFVYHEANTVYGWAAGVWNTMITWLTGLPGRIKTALAHMWDPISSLFKTAINAVIGVWDSLHFTIGGWKISGPFGTSVHLPSVTVGMPVIPKLAQGGLVTKEGLIYAHAGEAVTPLPKGGKLGPVVHIENAHFHDELDVEAFMKRAAWVATAKAM